MPRLLKIIAGALAWLGSLAASTAAHANRLEPLTPENSVLLMVDYQPQYVFSVHSIPTSELVNNATGLAKAAKVFSVPTVFTTVNAKSFGGPFFSQVQQARPDVTPVDRTGMNAWEEPKVRQAIVRTGRKKVLVAGLWTDSCVTLPVLSLLKEGYDVYVVTDASGDVNKDSHDMAVQRMVQAGAVPVTWLAVMLEWQRDWARTGTAKAISEIGKQHGGAWGQGIDYAHAMHVGQS